MIRVSFQTATRGLMNAIRIAHPHRCNESTIAAGITVATYPFVR
jgi:hypothetical protein